MNQEEAIKILEENVEYLRKVIPPDDIYMFTDQTFCAALFFLRKWSLSVDILKELEDPVTKKWVINLLSFYEARKDKRDVSLELNFEEDKDL